MWSQKQGGILKPKTMQLVMTEEAYAMVLAAAKRSGKSISRFGADLLLSEVLREGTRDIDAVVAIQNFQRMFCEVMTLSVTGKLTEARLLAVIERTAVAV